MSLLTDEDIGKATFIPDEYGDPDFCVTLFGKDRDRAIADASQAVTLKAVAEWLTENRHVDNCGNWYVYLTFKNSQKDRQEITWLKRLRKGLM